MYGPAHGHRRSALRQPDRPCPAIAGAIWSALCLPHRQTEKTCGSRNETDLMKPIYLDHNAPTPVDPDVLKAMLPFLRQDLGNPSSTHGPGRRARNAVEIARRGVAALRRAHADEIVFTSGGTEALNI